MKTRVIHTKIWKDSYYCSLNRAEKILFLYLITNEHINMIGLYEISSREILFDTGLTQQELEDAEAKFTKDKKFCFVGEWVQVINHEKYNTYGKGEKQQPAYEREWALVPHDIKVFIQNGYQPDTSMDTSSILDINHKSKIINQNTKEGGVGGTKKYATPDTVLPEDVKEIAELYKVSVRDVESKLEDLKDAVELNAKKYKYDNYKVALRKWVKMAITRGDFQVISSDPAEDMIAEAIRRKNAQ